VLSVQKQIQDLVDAGMTVRVIAHSFGGSVMSRVIENLKDTPYARRVVWYGVGTIYMTGLPFVRYIYHYKDIAIRCSGVAQGQAMYGEAPIKWIGRKTNKIDEKEAHRVTTTYWKTIIALLKK